MQTETALLYIDPFIASEGAPGWVRIESPVLERLPPASIVLATHEHDDHTDPFALRQLSENKECLFLGTSPSVEIARASGFAESQTHTLKIGEVFSQSPFTITALPVVDTDAQMPLAYLIEVAFNAGIWRLYHGGDAMMSDHFTKVGGQSTIDCCCLSAGGIHEGRQYYLTPVQTVEAARMLRAKTLIPVHWDLWTINSVEPSIWNTLKSEPNDLAIVVLHPGEFYWVAGS